MSEPPSPSSSHREELKKAAYEAIDDVRETEARRQAAKKQQRRTVAGSTLAVVLTLFAAWIWIAPPGFLMPEPLPEPTAQQYEDGLRMDMWMVAKRLERYAEREGRLPESMDEIREYSGEFVDITYEPDRDGTFTLAGARGPVVVSWSSSEPDSTLVQDAPQRIRSRGGP